MGKRRNAFRWVVKFESCEFTLLFNMNELSIFFGRKGFRSSHHHDNVLLHRHTARGASSFNGITESVPVLESLNWRETWHDWIDFVFPPHPIAILLLMFYAFNSPFCIIQLGQLFVFCWRSLGYEGLFSSLVSSLSLLTGYVWLVVWLAWLVSFNLTLDELLLSLVGKKSVLLQRCSVAWHDGPFHHHHYYTNHTV